MIERPAKTCAGTAPRQGSMVFLGVLLFRAHTCPGTPELFCWVFGKGKKNYDILKNPNNANVTIFFTFVRFAKTRTTPAIGVQRTVVSAYRTSSVHEQ